MMDFLSGLETLESPSHSEIIYRLYDFATILRMQTFRLTLVCVFYYIYLCICEGGWLCHPHVTVRRRLAPDLSKSTPQWKDHSGHKPQHIDSTIWQDENRDPNSSKTIALGKSLNVLTLCFGFCSVISG